MLVFNRIKKGLVSVLRGLRLRIVVLMDWEVEAMEGVVSRRTVGLRANFGRIGSVSRGRRLFVK